ncbi:MAG: hypothetical protein R3281_14475, partial [Balneolaceae bacterium]|nr:hypothetical protein [Balneolaceae bacterium]
MIVPDAHIDLNSTQWSENPRDAVVLLAISNKHDRSLLRDYLPATFDIRTSDDQSFIDVEFDICLIDEQHLLENREEVQQLKEDRSPEFIPFLLLSQSSGNRIHEAGLSHLVDDLISIPVPSEVLRSRMDLLLKTRAYSLKLVRQNRQLEENNRKLRIFEKAIQSVNTGVIITDAQQQDNPIVY